ncbi:MAG: ABC transporter permease [Gemmatimonadales bacterium]
MPVFDAIRMALHTITTQKLKSFFSLIGVLIGVTFLIAVVSIVQGMNVYMEDQFANRLIGLNTFTVRRQPGINTGNVTEETWRSWMRRPRITYDDADYITERLKTPVVVARYCSDRMVLSYNGKQAKDIEVMGTEPTYFEIKNVEIASGRIFTTQEVRVGTPVLVIGNDLAEKLFAGVDPIGKEATIRGLPYRIIGVAAKRGTLFGISLDKFAVMPFRAPARRYICPLNVLDEVQIKTANPTLMFAAMAETEALMRTHRALKPTQENNFDLQNASGALEGWKKISRILFLALPGLVAISLVVGGIVIMNIMLMAVAERTREIGIRKALGAKRRDILLQFIIESATLSTVGAAFGVATGIGLAFAVRALSPLPAAVAPWSIFVGVSLGVAVGMIAGVYPASRASRLDPITALRQE